MTTARRDGALAVGVLSGVCAVILATEATLSPGWFVFGGAGAIALELLAMRYRGPVRSLWERWPVQLGTLVVAVGVVVLAARVASTVLASLLLGGLVAYLCLLGAVVAGTVPSGGDGGS